MCFVSDTFLIVYYEGWVLLFAVGCWLFCFLGRVCWDALWIWLVWGFGWVRWFCVFGCLIVVVVCALDFCLRFILLGWVDLFYGLWFWGFGWVAIDCGCFRL